VAYFSQQNIEAELPMWEALSHVNICSVYGVSYEYPFTAALVLPFYPNGNVMNYIKLHSNADVYKLVRLHLFFPCIFFYVLNWKCRLRESRMDLTTSIPSTLP
jgi:hypothetical protein